MRPESGTPEIKTEENFMLSAEALQQAGEKIVSGIKASSDVVELTRRIEETPCTETELGDILAVMKAKKFYKRITMSAEEREDFYDRRNRGENGKDQKVTNLINSRTTPQLLALHQRLVLHERSCAHCQLVRERRRIVNSKLTRVSRAMSAGIP
jgi:hypothetical protein